MGLHQRYASLLEGQPLDFIAGRKEEEDKLRAELSRLFDGMMETLYKQEGDRRITPCRRTVTGKSEEGTNHFQSRLCLNLPKI